MPPPCERRSWRRASSIERQASRARRRGPPHERRLGATARVQTRQSSRGLARRPNRCTATHAGRPRDGTRTRVRLRPRSRRSSATTATRREGKFLGVRYPPGIVPRVLKALARLWERALGEHSSPPEIGWSIAVGVFSGCTPFVGLHMWIALALATLFRLNRLWAFAGSRISFAPLFAVITFCEIEGAHRLRTGTWLPLSLDEAASRARELLADWLIGALLFGGALAASLGLAAYIGMRSWQSRIAARSEAGAPGSPARPSSIMPPAAHAARPLPSESPPSGPPAPTH